MSKQSQDKPSSEEEERDSDEEEEEKYHMHLRHLPSISTEPDYEFPGSMEPGPSHLGLAEIGTTHPSGLRTRGPGRPRIHPLKPAGVSRPRGRPKGSKNKKPRKRLEKPPKRPRGRPRKWPPEMWEGFRTRQAVVQQRLRHQQHHQPEMPGPSHMFLEQPEVFIGPDVLTVPPSGHIHHSSAMPRQHMSQPPQRHLPHYMHMGSEAAQSRDHRLVLQQQGTSGELMPSHHQHVAHILPGVEEHAGERMEDPEELLWMQHLPSGLQHPPSTSR